MKECPPVPVCPTAAPPPRSHNLNYGADLIGRAMASADVATTVSPTYAREVGPVRRSPHDASCIQQVTNAPFTTGVERPAHLFSTHTCRRHAM